MSERTKKNHEWAKPATAEEIGWLDKAMVSLFSGNHGSRTNDAAAAPQRNGICKRLPYMGKNGELMIGVSRLAEHGEDVASRMEVVVKHTHEGSYITPSWNPGGDGSKFTFLADKSGVVTHNRTYSKYNGDGDVIDTTDREVSRLEMGRLMKLVGLLESAERAEKQNRSFIIRYFTNQRVMNSASGLIGTRYKVDASNYEELREGNG